MHQALAIAPYSAGYCSFVDEAGPVETSDIFRAGSLEVALAVWCFYGFCVGSGSLLQRASTVVLASLVFVWPFGASLSGVACSVTLYSGSCCRGPGAPRYLLCFVEPPAVPPSMAELAAAGRGARASCIVTLFGGALLPRAEGPAIIAVERSAFALARGNCWRGVGFRGLAPS